MCHVYALLSFPVHFCLRCEHGQWGICSLAFEFGGNIGRLSGKQKWKQFLIRINELHCTPQLTCLSTQGRSYIWGNRGSHLGCFQDCCLSENNITSTIFSERELTFTFAILLSPVSLSVVSLVCNVRAPYSSGSNFRHYFYGNRYLGHPLKISRRSSQGIPSAGGVKHKRGSQV